MCFPLQWVDFMADPFLKSAASVEEFQQIGHCSRTDPMYAIPEVDQSNDKTEVSDSLAAFCSG